MRTSARSRRGGSENRVGEVVAIFPDGWAWTPAERAAFHVVRVSDAAPGWIVDRLLARALLFRGFPTAIDGTESDLVPKLCDREGRAVNKLRELGRRAQLRDAEDTRAATDRARRDA